MSDYTKIGLGLAALGRPDYINIRQEEALDKSKAHFEANALAMLDEAYALGIRYIDTAPSYGLGEAYVLAWQQSRKPLDMMISTKWGYTYKANWEIGFKGKHEVKEHSLAKLNEQWAVSKALLPNLGIYQVHSATFESGILENSAVLQRLFELKQQHKIDLGISTSGIHQEALIKAALQIKIEEQTLFDSFQVTYNILDQSTFQCLKQLIAMGKTLIVKEGLANGRIFRNPDYPSYNPVYEVLEGLAKKYEVGVDAIALRFIIDHLGPSYLLSGASTAKQLRENLRAQDIQLDQAAIEALKATFQTADEYWREREMMAWQ